MTQLLLSFLLETLLNDHELGIKTFIVFVELVNLTIIDDSC